MRAGGSERDDRYRIHTDYTEELWPYSVGLHQERRLKAERRRFRDIQFHFSSSRSDKQANIESEQVRNPDSETLYLETKEKAESGQAAPDYVS